MKLIPSLILASFLLLNGTDATAQTFQWLSRIGGPSYDPTPLRPDELVNDMVADELGNVYVCGRIRNNSNINGTPVNTYGGNDIFVAKFDCSGNLVWVRVAGNSDDGDNGLALALDGLGNIYVTGQIYGRHNPGGPFDSPIHLFDTVYHLNTQSMFLAKLDTGGNFIWGKIAQTACYGEKIVIDSQGKINVLVNNFDNDPGEIFPGVPVIRAFYIARFDPAGNVEKMLQITGEPRLYFQDLKLSPENEFYLVAYSNWDSITIGGVTLYGIAPQNSPDFYFFKLDTSGLAQWYIHYGLNAFSFSYGYGCALDANGDVFITGAAYGGLVLGNDTLHNSLGAIPAIDFPFVAKVSPQGQVIWARNLHTNLGRSTGGIAVKSNGNAVVSGFFSGSVIIGPDSFAGSGTNNLFIAEFSHDGNTIRGEAVPTVNGGSDTRPFRTVCDAGDDILFAGSFSGNLIINGNMIPYAGGYTDGFVIKWGSALCTVGMDDALVSGNRNVLLYPNPATDYVNFRFEKALNASCRLSIFDVTGREVASAEIRQQTVEQRISVQGLSTGLYYYRIEGKGLQTSGKFLVAGK